MTDAERIAEYLTAVSASGEEWTLADVQRNAGLRGGRSSLLLAMLSDVRREEREACATEVRRELVEAERQGERMAAKRLGWALKHIRVRGDQ